jgi:hypothetical protein
LRLGKLGSAAAREAAMAEKLKNYSRILDKFNSMDEATKLKFMDDFANASDDVLKALNREGSELLESWKTFRKKYPNENIRCN